MDNISYFICFFIYHIYKSYLALRFLTKFILGTALSKIRARCESVSTYRVSTKGCSSISIALLKCFILVKNALVPINSQLYPSSIARISFSNIVLTYMFFRELSKLNEVVPVVSSIT